MSHCKSQSSLRVSWYLRVVPSSFAGVCCHVRCHVFFQHILFTTRALHAFSFGRRIDLGKVNVTNFLQRQSNSCFVWIRAVDSGKCSWNLYLYSIVIIIHSYIFVNLIINMYIKLYIQYQYHPYQEKDANPVSWGRVLVNFALQTTSVAGPLIPPNLSWSGRTKHGRGACTPPHAFNIFNYFPIHVLGNERKPHDVDNFRLTWPHMRQIEAAQVLEGLWIYPGFVHFACTKEWCLKMFSEKRLVWPLFLGISN